MWNSPWTTAFGIRRPYRIPYKTSVSLVLVIEIALLSKKKRFLLPFLSATVPERIAIDIISRRYFSNDEVTDRMYLKTRNLRPIMKLFVLIHPEMHSRAFLSPIPLVSPMAEQANNFRLDSRRSGELDINWWIHSWDSPIGNF